MARAEVRHILVDNEEICTQIKEKILGGEVSFTEAAESYSECPSGNTGGDLGVFGPGEMVPEFDKVVFNEEINIVHGPVQTQFGFHLIEIIKRED